MLISSATKCSGAHFAEVCWEAQRRYAARHGKEHRVHIVDRSMGDFEHRLPVMLRDPSDIVEYIEWDVLPSDDAPDLLPMLGDADVMLAPMDFAPKVEEKLRKATPALEFPWHMIPLMVIRREALVEIAKIQPHCHVYTRSLPTEAARYEGTVLMAIQRAGLKLKTLPSGLHQLSSEAQEAPFLHFEGPQQKRKLSHASTRQSY